MSNFHIDLNIVDGDLNLDEVLAPAKLNVADVIAQDIKHRLLESGLLVRLVKLRNKNSISMILTEIELIVEQDNRLVPGSINVFVTHRKTIAIKAATKEYGKIGASDAVSTRL